ncbi:MAG: TSUP family transporter [Anaeromyxobacteraceae bacterium]
MTDPSPLAIALLTLTGLAAGTVDAVAGGGGLLTFPVLLAAGLPPHLAVATNKGQSTFGSAAALVRFWRGGLVDPARARVGFPAGFAGSLAGAALVLAVRPAVLRPVVIVLLVAVAVFTATRRGPPRLAARIPPARGSLAVAGIALVLGAYDGFFGPGTGTFLIVAFASLLGDSLQRASGEAKAVNFASNLAALALFAARGLVVWRIALPMAAAQLLGGTLGAHLVVRKGDVLVRRIVLAVVLALVVKLGADLASARS